MTRPLHEVSVKAALYSEDGSKVLAAIYADTPERFLTGLPGGHVEADEDPDAAIARELYEELGVEALELERRDFWRHTMGKVLLGYVGRLHSDQVFALDPAELTRVEWVDVAAIRDGSFPLDNYREFVTANQPSS